MSTPRKKEAVAELKKRLDGAQAVVLAAFTGLAVEGMSKLRREFRKNDSTFYIVKNTLGRIAVRDLDMEGLETYLEHGPTGWAVTAADPTAPAKVLAEFAKTHKVPTVKGGYMDGAILSPDEVKRVASLPPKPVLVAQILGLLQSPVQGVVTATNAVMTSLAVAVNEIKKKREEEGAS